MADDNSTILEIGTVVDTSAAAAGMREVSSIVQSATGEMSAAFKQVDTAATTAAASIPAVTAPAAAAAAEAVESTIPPAAAKASKAILGMGEASEGFLARFKAALASAGESLGVFHERLYMTASGLRGSLNETVGSFSGLGGILASVLGVEIFEHFINATEETVLHLGHMAETIGMNINELNGFRLAMDSMGISFDRAAMSLTRLQRGAQEALEGSKSYVDAFQRIGISVNELRGMRPDEIVYRTADALKNTESSGARAASAFILLGRGGYEMIPAFQQGGAALKQLVDRFKEMSPDMKAAYEAALQYRQQQAELSAQWQTVSIPVMEVVVKLVQVLRTVFEGLVIGVEAGVAILDEAFIELLTGVENIVAPIAAAFNGIKASIAPIIAAIAKSMHFDFKGAYEEIQKAGQSFVEGWHQVGTNLEAENAKNRAMFNNVYNNLAHDANKTWDEIQQIWKKPIVPPSIEAPLDNTGGVDAESRISKWQDELNRKKLALDQYHTLSIADEVAFWQQIKQTHELTEQEEASIDSKLLTLRQQLGREDISRMVADERQKVAATQQGSSQRYQLEVDLLNKLKALASAGAGEVSPDLARQIEEQTTRVAAAAKSMSDIEKRTAVQTELSKVEATKQGTDARIAEDQKFLALVESLYGRESTEYAEAQRKINADALRYEQERQTIAENELKTNEQIQLLQLEDQKAAYEARVPAAARTSEQVLNVERNFARQEYEIKRQALEQELALMAQDPNSSPSKMAALKQQLLVLEQQYYNQVNAISRQSHDYIKTLQQDLMNSFKSSFASGLSGLITGTKTFAQAWNEVIRGIITAFAQMVAQMITDWIMGHLIMKLFGTTTTAEMNTAKAESDAAVAAAGAFAYWSAIQPEIAGAMAAAQYAEAQTWVAAAGAAGVAEKGALVPEDMPIFAHAQEMILPASIARGLQELIATGTSTDSTVNKSSLASSNVVKSISDVMRTSVTGIAQQGGLVPQNMPIFAHAGAIIIPAPLAGGLQQVARTMSSASTTAFNSVTTNKSAASDSSHAVEFAAGQEIKTGFAQKGAVISQDMPIFAHADEMVLPAPISLGLQNLIATGSNGTPGAGGAAGATGAAGTVAGALIPEIKLLSSQNVTALKTLFQMNPLVPSRGDVLQTAQQGTSAFSVSSTTREKVSSTPESQSKRPIQVTVAPVVHAIDGASVERFFSQHEDKLGASMTRALRKGLVKVPR